MVIEKNRLIAIGDIHGQNAILEKILVAINPQPEDVFVFLGDYIDRGPDSKGVIETISDLQKFFPERNFNLTK